MALPSIGSSPSPGYDAIPKEPSAHPFDKRRSFIDDYFSSGTILMGADLSDANLSDADLRGIHLTAANLGESDQTGTLLARASLTRARLTNAVMGMRPWRTKRQPVSVGRRVPVGSGPEATPLSDGPPDGLTPTLASDVDPYPWGHRMNRVRACVAVPVEFLPVMVNVKAPMAVGVPEMVAVPLPLLVKVTPLGRVPVSVREGVG